MTGLSGLLLIIICVGTFINLHLSSVDRKYTNSVNKAGNTIKEVINFIGKKGTY